LSYNFNNNTFKKKEKPEDQIKGEPTSSDEYEDTDPDVLDKQGPRRLRDKKKDNSKKDDEGYEKFSLPWNFNISASVSYGDKKFNKERLTYDQDWSCMLNFSGSFTFTRNWSFNYSSGYDVIRKEISYTTCGISRSLHCWSASLNLVPFGYNQSFNFTIHANSSLLQDLKYEKSSSPSDHPDWY
ncbi:MAG: LPS-assembly protein LptD, partial [Paludibacteraceae bacterium]|nr:LPS-assembly protein LptD [Paludibacteraceae bacterium]